MSRAVDAVVCARMGASRLPGKVLLRAVGRPLLELLLERLSRIRKIVVATTVNEEDEEIVQLCRRLGLPCFRGLAEDVLGRVWECILTFSMDHVAYFGADNPLVDPAVCDQVTAVYQKLGLRHQQPTALLICSGEACQASTPPSS